MGITNLFFSPVAASEQGSLPSWAAVWEGKARPWMSESWWRCGWKRLTEPLAACPAGLFLLPFPARELHVNLFLMGNYLLFGLFMCLFFFFRGGTGWIGVRRVGDRKGGEFPDIPDSVAAGENSLGWMVN